MIDKHEAARLSEELRARFGIDNLSPIDVFACTRTIKDLTTVAYPLGDSISGLCVKHEDFNLIAFNSSQTLGRQRFTIAHELYHLYFDSSRATVVCPKSPSRFDDTEKMADSFASYFLLPYHALRNELRSRGLAAGQFFDDAQLPSSIVEIEQKFGISRMALLVRLEDEGAIDSDLKNSLSHDVKASARRLGYSTALYEPRRGTSRCMADGDYIDRLCLLFERELISQGKAEELLRDGFRDDIGIETLETSEYVD